ncbi:putative PEP-binding protein [Streptomyces peucetius]|nr:hypothetical protein CGZ69_02085 [Streptomyces peucetius subsp. caesius ATCC 27952]
MSPTSTTTLTGHGVWQPALLTLVAKVCSDAAAAGRPVGVCGEAAADPLLAPVLAGLGVSSLSMAAPAVADVHDALARLTLEQFRSLAAAALGATAPAAARGTVHRTGEAFRAAADDGKGC